MKTSRIWAATLATFAFGVAGPLACATAEPEQEPEEEVSDSSLDAKTTLIVKGVTPQTGQADADADADSPAVVSPQQRTAGETGAVFREVRLLSESTKCIIPKGRYDLSNTPTLVDGLYYVTFKAEPKGLAGRTCGIGGWVESSAVDFSFEAAIAEAPKTPEKLPSKPTTPAKPTSTPSCRQSSSYGSCSLGRNRVIPSPCIEVETIKNCKVAANTAFADAVRNALNDPANSGVRCTGPRSSFRTTAIQQSLVCELGCYTNARGYGAACDTMSNHQRGLAVDLTRGLARGHRYGLITGVSGEPWHHSLSGH